VQSSAVAWQNSKNLGAGFISHFLSFNQLEKLQLTTARGYLTQWGHIAGL
jgi:hypothetical protein